MHQPRAPFEELCAQIDLSKLVYSHVRAHHHRLSVHSRVGSGLCHKKKLLGFHFSRVWFAVVVCESLFMFWKAEQARKGDCITLSLSKEQKMKTWQSGKTRERENKRWCTADLGSPQWTMRCMKVYHRVYKLSINTSLFSGCILKIILLIQISFTDLFWKCFFFYVCSINHIQLMHMLWNSP